EVALFELKTTRSRCGADEAEEATRRRRVLPDRVQRCVDLTAARGLLLRSAESAVSRLVLKEVRRVDVVSLLEPVKSTLRTEDHIVLSRGERGDVESAGTNPAIHVRVVTHVSHRLERIGRTRPTTNEWILRIVTCGILCIQVHHCRRVREQVERAHAARVVVSGDTTIVTAANECGADVRSDLVTDDLVQVEANVLPHGTGVPHDAVFFLVRRSEEVLGRLG